MDKQNLANLFRAKTKRKSLANITHIRNIPSVLDHGILSHEEAMQISHSTIALEDVQKKRQGKILNGLYLHQYACLYFSPRNPMMYYRKCHSDSIHMEDLCVLMINPDVLNLEGVVISDGNAASEISRFFTARSGLLALNFDMIYATWWNTDDPFEKAERKRIKCAEVLVPYRIPINFIEGAVVPTARTGDLLRSLGLQGQIIVDPNTFFLGGERSESADR